MENTSRKSNSPKKVLLPKLENGTVKLSEVWMREQLSNNCPQHQLLPISGAL